MASSRSELLDSPNLLQKTLTKPSTKGVSPRAQLNMRLRRCAKKVLTGDLWLEFMLVLSMGSNVSVAPEIGKTQCWQGRLQEQWSLRLVTKAKTRSWSMPLPVVRLPPRLSSLTIIISTESQSSDWTNHGCCIQIWSIWRRFLCLFPIKQKCSVFRMNTFKYHEH